jgi:agmatine deiminase
MTPDWAANQVYVSDLLAKRHPKVRQGLEILLNQAGMSLGVVKKTRDIWIRDYAPIQMKEDYYFQFTYAPDYLKGCESSITPPEACRLKTMTNYRKVDLVLDGGNVVAAEKRVILTDKIYKENPGRTASQIVDLLEEVLKAEVVVIPKEPYDKIGHADGVVRFLSEDRVVCNDYSAAEPKYGEKLRKMLEKAGLSVEYLPYRPRRAKTANHVGSAVGCWVNYLRLGNLVVVPAYNEPEDETALQRMKLLLPGARLHQLPCGPLAEEGGVLNCVTYTTREYGRHPKAAVR